MGASQREQATYANEQGVYRVVLLNSHELGYDS